jgi:hypothetical protein
MVKGFSYLRKITIKVRLHEEFPGSDHITVPLQR